MIKQFISKLIRNRIFYPLWKFGYRLSLYGMNFGVASGYADYSGELYLIKRIKKYILKNKINTNQPYIVFDIGANIGDWSKFLIDEYNDINYKLFAFEPSLPTYNELINNIKNINKINCYNIGFGDKNENITIYYDSKGQGSAGAFATSSKYSEQVKITTLDSFCQQHKISKINFLKMDVQGYEYNILKGASHILSNKLVDIIQFEIDEPNIYQRVFFKDFWDKLSENYTIFHSLYNGLVEIKSYNYSLEKFHCMNYVAILKDIDL